MGRVAILFFCLVIGGLDCSKAETVTLLDGTVYEGVTVSKVEPTQITLMTDSGIKKVPLEKLSPELQKQYGFDPEKAKTYQQEQEQKALAARAQIAQEFSDAQVEEFLKKRAIDASGKNLQVLQDGILTKIWVSKSYEVTKTRDPNSGYSGVVFKKPNETTTREVTRDIQLENLAFLECGTADLADGESWSGTIYPCGTYAYINAMGVRRTVKKYTVSQKSALRYLQSKR